MLTVSWAQGDNWLCRLGGTTNLNVQLALDWLAADASFGEESHRITLVNVGPTNVALTWSPSTDTNWIFVKPVITNIAPNQIYRLVLDHLTPGSQDPAWLVDYSTVTNAEAAPAF